MRGNLRGRRRGMGKFRGPCVNSMNLGSPWRETSRNWEKVMRLPDFGYSDVTRSKVRALLRVKLVQDNRYGRWKQHEPAASAKYKTQGSDPFNHHLCKRQPPDEVDVIQAPLIERAHDEIVPASKSGHECWSGSCSVLSTCRVSESFGHGNDDIMINLGASHSLVSRPTVDTDDEVEYCR